MCLAAMLMLIVSGCVSGPAGEPICLRSEGPRAALAAALLALIGYQLWVLTAKLRTRVFGSRLTLRFLLMFLPMVIVPGGLVYVVSLQFMAKSIESWFDVRVDNALEGGLNLGRNALDYLMLDATWAAASPASACASRSTATTRHPESSRKRAWRP